MLHMDNTGLREIESHFLQVTGLYRLEITNNLIHFIPDDGFFGLERSLWELILHKNNLIDVPSRAIRHLQKLRYLDLSGNQISTFQSDAWRGLEDSLQTLILSDNSLSVLPADGFSGLPQLETLDLSGNNLAEIDGSVFRDGMMKLTKLLLSDNILSKMPYSELSPLKQLRTLDISHNHISDMLHEDQFNLSIILTLDNLHLEYNSLTELEPSSFQYFESINRTFLDGNPIVIVHDDAFRQARIKELYMRHCHLNSISPDAFNGLDGSLQILDMSGNNLTNLPDQILNHFDVLRYFLMIFWK